MAGQEVLAEAFLDQSGKAVKALAHIGRPRAKEHADGRGELREHQSPPRPSPPSRAARPDGDAEQFRIDGPRQPHDACASGKAA